MIEVGEYVRTKKGIIGKLVVETLTYPEPSEWVLATNGNHQEVIVECTDYPIKHSKNIIDLIEVGDYVNGYKVSDKEGTLLITNVKGIDRSGYHIPISQYGDGIKSTVTKEQFKQREYRLEEQ